MMTTMTMTDINIQLPMKDRTHYSLVEAPYTHYPAQCLSLLILRTLHNGPMPF